MTDNHYAMDITKNTDTWNQPREKFSTPVEGENPNKTKERAVNNKKIKQSTMGNTRDRRTDKSETLQFYELSTLNSRTLT